MKGTFFTEKRLDAVSKTSLTLFQAMVISVIVGGVFDKIASLQMRVVFGVLSLVFLVGGIILADNRKTKE